MGLFNSQADKYYHSVAWGAMEASFGLKMALEKGKIQIKSPGYIFLTVGFFLVSIKTPSMLVSGPSLKVGSLFWGVGR